MEDAQQGHLGQIRTRLNTLFDDAGLDAFCLDSFPAVYDKFSRGMRKDEKLTLLLDHFRRSRNWDPLLTAIQAQEAQLTSLEIASPHLSRFGVKSDLRIPWSVVKESCDVTSAPRLEFVAERFDKNLYVHRWDVQNQIDHFLETADKRYFVLVGKSGMGKSAFLWSLADKLQQDPHVACLFCDANIHLAGRQSATEALLEDLAKRLGVTPESVLRVIQPSDKRSKHRLVLVVDAINEFQSMNQVERILRRFHSDAAAYPWLRLILSCRPHFWTYIENQRGVIGIADRYFYRDDKKDQLFVRLDYPTDSEMKDLYRKHRDKYHFDPGSFSDLDPKTQRRLREPLMLWLVSEVCSGKNISAETGLTLVDVKAIPEYVAKLQQQGHLSTQGKSFLETTLPGLFVRDGFCVNRLPRRHLIESCTKEGTGGIPQGHLIESCTREDIERILENLIRSKILKEDGMQMLSFSFERFYGYYLGLYLQKVANEGQAVDCRTIE